MCLAAQEAAGTVVAHRGAEEQAQNAAHLVIEFAGSELAFLDQLLVRHCHEVSVIGVAGAPGQTVGPAAKLHVQAVLDSHLGVVGTTPVAHHHAVILPVTLEYLIEGVLVLATVLILIEVIGAHDAPGVTLLDSSLKGGQVNLTQGTVAHDDVDLMAIFFIVVQAEVLDTRRSACRLQTLNVGHYHAGRQQGILAHVLKVAAIQWRAVDVHTRSQDHVLATVARFLTQAAAIQPGQNWVP